MIAATSYDSVNVYVLYPVTIAGCLRRHVNFRIPTKTLY